MAGPPPGSASNLAIGSSFRSSATHLRPQTPDARARSGGEGLFGGGAFLLCGLCDTGEHRGGIAVQYLLARVLADLGFGERLPGPVAPKFGAIGAADDALGAVQPDGRLDGA